jgi:hypothetical protein
MAFRFRRSVQIVPGVRLNFSKGGVSTSVGVRGASMTVGQRGVYGTVGLPGTGMSYRTRLAAPQGRSAARGSYRELNRQLREYERQAERRQAAAEHERQEAHLEALRSVLRERVRTPFPWAEAVAPLPPYHPQPFVEPKPPSSEGSIERELADRLPYWPWAAGAVVCLVLAGLAPAAWLRITGILAVLSCAAMAFLVDRRRDALRPTLEQRRAAERERRLQQAHAEHAANEAERRAARTLESDARERLRTAVEREDAEPLAELLAEELANEELPLPLVFDLEFGGTDEVLIELVLPDLAELPERRSTLTSTGRLSSRRLPQRDRTAIYADLCCGLALRLVHETLRVLPIIEQVEITGIAEILDPATGHREELTALRLATTRADFARLNLDRVQPRAALEGLGGRFALTARGELRGV